MVTAKGISYTRLRELVLESFVGIVPDLSKIGTHSLRSGGASAAANAGVAGCLLKQHGHWLSDSAKDGYVKDSLNAHLSVSKALTLYPPRVPIGTLEFLHQDTKSANWHSFGCYV